MTELKIFLVFACVIGVATYFANRDRTPPYEPQMLVYIDGNGTRKEIGIDENGVLAEHHDSDWVELKDSSQARMVRTKIMNLVYKIHE